MKTALFLLFAVLFMLSISDVRSGTLVPPGHGGTVCQGSTCTPSEGGSGGGVVGGNAAAAAQATATATASQKVNQRQSTTVTVGGATQTVSVSGGSDGAGVRYEERVDVGLAVPPATAPCRVSVGAGYGGAFGIMLGGSVLDEGCDTREDVRSLMAVGLQGAAIRRMCQKAEMADAIGTDLCPQQPAQKSGGFAH